MDGANALFTFSVITPNLMNGIDFFLIYSAFNTFVRLPHLGHFWKFSEWFLRGHAGSFELVILGNFENVHFSAKNHSENLQK